MDTLANLRAFLATVRGGNFSEAARQLDTVPSVVAKRIGHLEWTLGTRLFDRSSRKVMLTEAGHKFHARARALVSDFDDIASELRRDENALDGQIRLRAPTSLTVLYLADILSAFQQRYDRLTLEIMLLDRSANPAEEGFDISVSGRADSYEGVIDEPLCPLRQVVCAAPAYLARRPAPRHPRELADHDCLVFTPTGHTWRFNSARGPVNVDVPARLGANDNYVLYAAARAGNGIAVLPTYIARQALDDGTLVALLEDHPLQDVWLKALIPARKRQLPRIEALLAWLREHLGGMPPWERPAARLRR
ncbi:MAG: LysR family transcriptional regulator [Pigmentiphaga sp.]|uniref:LysR family transcriptional regulator n=1 Tax=Pigmentiphaga sp. TaxID=1977564 RepID=UPI0029A9E5D6|nr:LysR family transcriptional regulator [Pigmentiphaga sp.]MDX3907194.1 LysR family transcriptional regulator [Pigmentiphaga sp.]